MTTVRTGSALAVALLAAAAGASTFAQQDSPPSFRSGINAVRVDVIVTDGDGRPVPDLVQSDFEVYEDGAPQSIDRFALIRVDGSESFGQYAPQPIRSLIDEQTQAGRSDVALYLLYFNDLYLRPDRAGRILDPLVQFVRRLPPGDMVGVMDALTPLSAVMLTRDRESVTQAIRAKADIDLRERRLRALLNLESVQPYPLYEGLEAASLHLASLREARQSIVLISSVAPSTQSPDFSGLVRRLNANNTAVYVVDPSGLVPGGGSFRGSDLRELADRTGGLAVTRTNAIDTGLDRIAADGRLQYVLTYTSPAPADGRFHEISVRVRRQGVRVRARSGFLALSAEEMRRAAPPPRPVDASVLSALSATVTAATLVRTWVGTARGEHGATRVTLAWELIPAAPGERRDTPRRVAVSATARGDATIYSSEDGTPTVLAVDSRVPQSVSFDAPPGVLALRVEVYGNEDVLDVESRAVEVPAYEGRSMSTPRVYAARSAAELRTIRSTPDRAPVARREFSRTEQLFVRFESYATRAPLRAGLLNQAGERLHDLTIAAGETPGSHEITTGVSHLAVGDYVLEIVLGSDPETRTLVPLRIRQ